MQVNETTARSTNTTTMPRDSRKETTSKTTYWTRKQRCLGLQEQPKDPQIKLENLQPRKLKCLQKEHSKSLQLKQGCIKQP